MQTLIQKYVAKKKLKLLITEKVKVEYLGLKDVNDNIIESEIITGKYAVKQHVNIGMCVRAFKHSNFLF